MLRSIVQSRRRRGAEAVEFALTFPVFLLLIMGGIELSWFLGQNACMFLALRTGARAGAVERDADTVAAAQAAAAAEWSKFGFGSTVTWTVTLVGANPNRRVNVTGNMTYASLTGMFPYVSGMQLTRMTDMYMEDQYVNP